ncbi:MAG: hypothetical protein JNG89_06965 [Planctomycetaceae bacterium]|nr:hypothetical protein [Planctomycetaceae bacterium]
MRCDALIDTGFDGELVLPSDLLDRLAWPHRGRRTAILGDGSRTSFSTYRGNVMWHGGVRAVHVLEGVNDAIVGMRLLVGTRVTMEIVADGAVFVDVLIQE